MEFIPGPWELIIILIIVAMLFGVGRLPEVFGAVGRGLREFRQEMGTSPKSTEKSSEKLTTDNTSTATPTERETTHE
ncbi:MAG: twin-arginine translocase TatA/TatE family subunit [Caldilineaceae bacterium]